MHRTTIMLPQELKFKATEQARSLGISLGELIRYSLESYLNRAYSAEGKDLFLSDIALSDADVPSDLSEEHDEYLYGDRS